MSEPIAEFTDDLYWMGWEMVASGYAGVWATENTREAIFDAMRRKEVYGTALVHESASAPRLASARDPDPS